MTWYAPRTWTDGEIVSGAVFLQQLYYDLLASGVATVQAAGDLFYADGPNSLTRLAAGTAAQALVVNPGATAPTWVDNAPWRIEIEPEAGGESNTNFNTPVPSVNPAYGGYLSSDAPGLQNAEVTFSVFLAKGTWTVSLMYHKDINRGIVSVQLDGVEVGTVDTYNASGVSNNVTSITGIAVAATGKKALKLKMTSKNASSSAYFGSIQHVTLLRTA